MSRSNPNRIAAAVLNRNTTDVQSAKGEFVTYADAANFLRENTDLDGMTVIGPDISQMTAIDFLASYDSGDIVDD